MNNRDYIPPTKDAFKDWAENFMDHFGVAVGDGFLAGNADAAGAYNLIVPVYEDYKRAYAAAADPSRATVITIRERQRLHRELKAVLRAFIKSYVTYNMGVSDQARERLGLPVHKKERHAAPVPTTYPDCDVDTSTIRRLTFDFHDRDKSGRAKPEGVHGCELKWVMRDTAPESYSELVNSSFDTHSPLTLTFDLKDKGKTVWFALRWENTRGEKGPWSELMSAVIP